MSDPATFPAPILLYDGTCGLCARSVQFVLQHERRAKTLRFASLQGATGTAVRRRHPELESVDSVIWYAPAESSGAERVLVKSNAALEVLSYLGGGWRALAMLSRMAPRVLRDAVYDLVARHRHKLAGGDVCVLPTPEERVRFLDMA